tara:strand:- start:621 stop:1931 length:1311 start_codon:yes stop_codon:yes gene_type:complete
MLNAENELKKWAPVLEHADAAPITDPYKKAVTAKLLENTEKAIQEEKAHSSFSLNEGQTTTGAVDTFDPVLISLVRRAMPNLIAYDVAGVQPMSGPTGLIFAMKARIGDGTNAIDNGDAEAFGTAAPDTGFSGSDNNSPVGVEAGEAQSLFDSPAGAVTTGTGIDAAFAELASSSTAGNKFGEMGFTIDKSTVTAKTRQLKAEYTMELAQDLKAVHGLDAESELANILSGEILGEINREVIRSIISTSKRGCQSNTHTEAQFDLTTDADGRWAVEKFQSLLFQIELEANAIAKGTRRGKGNFVICSTGVASALAATGGITLPSDLTVDATGNTFAGTLKSGLKVYVDPYATVDYATVGYKGDSAYDAGMFYCPYVPLTMVRAVGENSFQPKIAFKTRYGLQANPLSAATGTVAGIGGANSNEYYRTFLVKNINVEG